MAEVDGLHSSISADASDYVREHQRAGRAIDELVRDSRRLNLAMGRTSQAADMAGDEVRQLGGEVRDARAIVSGFETQMLGAGSALSRSGARLSATGRAFRAFRGQTVNVSHQLQDISVQMAMGTHWTVALGQNLPQLASGFGAVGAMLGVLAAIGFPILALAMRGAAGDTETFTKTLDEGKDALEEYKTLMESIDSDLGDIFEKGLKSVEANSQALKDLALIARNEAMQSIRSLTQAFADSTTEVGFWRKAIGGTDIGVVGDLLEIETLLQGHIGIWKDNREEVYNFIEAVRGINDATSLQEMYDQAVLVRDMFKSQVDVTGELTEAQQAFWKQISQTIFELERMGVLEGGVDAKGIQNSIEAHSEYVRLRLQGEKLIAEQQKKSQEAQAQYYASLIRGEEFAAAAAERARAVYAEYYASRLTGEQHLNNIIQQNKNNFIDGATAAKNIWQELNERLRENLALHGDIAREANAIISAANQSLALKRLELAYGRDSAEYLRQQQVYEREALGLRIRSEGISEELAARLREALGYAQAIAQVEMASGIEKAAAAARVLAAEFGLAYNQAFALQTLMSTMGKGGLGFGGNVPKSSPGMFGLPGSTLGAFQPNGSVTGQNIVRPPSRGAVGGVSGGSRGGGGGGGAETENPLIAQIEQLREALMTEEELLINSYETKQQMLTDALDQKLLTLEEYNELEKGLTLEHTKAMETLHYNSLSKTVGYYGTLMGNMATIFEAGGKKMVGITKAFSIAQGLLNAYRAYTEVLADPSLMGRPVLRQVLAASTLAAGLAQVANMRSTNYGSSGGGGGGGGGGGSSAPSAPPPTNYYFDLQGDTFSRASVEDLIARSLQAEVDRGARVVFNGRTI